jgi:hypothetical protein
MAEVIDFFSAWLDRRVAAGEKEATTVGNSWSLAVVVLTRVSLPIVLPVASAPNKKAPT